MGEKIFDDGNWRIVCQRAWLPAFIRQRYAVVGVVGGRWIWLKEYTRVSYRQIDGNWKTFDTKIGKTTKEDLQKFWAEFQKAKISK